MMFPTPDEHAYLERELGLRLPFAYLELVTARSSLFAAVFPRARFFLTIKDLQRARSEISSKLRPFFAHDEPAHTDYYCFDPKTKGPDFGVVVFAIHTIVASWPTCSSFVAWVQKQSPT